MAVHNFRRCSLRARRDRNPVQNFENIVAQFQTQAQHKDKDPEDKQNSNHFKTHEAQIFSRVVKIKEANDQAKNFDFLHEKGVNFMVL